MINVFQKVLMIVTLLLFSFPIFTVTVHAQYADRDSVKFPVQYPPFAGQNVVIEVRAYNRDTGAVTMHNVSTALGGDGSSIVQIGNLQPDADYNFSARMRLTGENFYGNYAQDFNARTYPNFDGGGKVRVDRGDQYYNGYNNNNYPGNYQNNYGGNYPSYYNPNAYGPTPNYPNYVPGGYAGGYYYTGPRNPFADWSDDRYPPPGGSGKVCL